MAAAPAAKKLRPEEEAEEELHLAFRGAANALSQVYTQGMALQKASFLAGERSSMESVYQWISSKHEEGLEVSVADILAYLQTKIGPRAEGIRGSFQLTSPQPAYHCPSTDVQSNSFSFGSVAAALNSHTGQTDQTRIASTLDVLPNPSRQNLHSNHLVHGSAYGNINSLSDGNGAQGNNSPQNQNFMHWNSYDRSMDMNHDAP